jgi:hypothetical protein
MRERLRTHFHNVDPTLRTAASAVPDDEDTAYHLARAEAELEWAQRALHPAAVRAHYELAGAHLDRVYGPQH